MNTQKDKNASSRNAFTKCTTPLEIFHRERSVRTNIAQELGRIGYFVEKNNELVIHGENKPALKNLGEVIKERSSQFNLVDAYKNPDFFLPANMLYGMISSEEWQKNGIEVSTLKGNLIYPLYGVWSPTSQEYLSLVDLYMKSLSEPEKVENVIDLGCGTGILGILAAKYKTSGELIGVDNYANAIECTKINAQVHGLGSKMKALMFDLTKIYYNKMLFSEIVDDYSDRPSLVSPAFLQEKMTYKKVANQIGMPSSYDLIL